MYVVFSRRWWKENPAWPNGLEPDSRAPKTKHATCETEAEARGLCRELNATENLTARQRRLGVKFEYTSNWR